MPLALVMATEVSSVSLLLASTLSWIGNSGFLSVPATALLKSSTAGNAGNTDIFESHNASDRTTNELVY